MVHEISKTNSVFNEFIAGIRDCEIQKDPLRFRKNMERMGAILGYEISKTLDYQTTPVTTPLGVANVNRLCNQPVIASILRAGLTLHYGLLGVFDRAENAFISAYREEKNPGKITVQLGYLACPDLTGKTLIIADPMLATGSSMSLVCEAILRNGTPSKVHIASAVASRQAIDHVQKNLPSGTEIWVGVIDPELNANAYIIPGIGDAGDLAFGLKL
jgi:uracil phosphoribosyltransferase